MKWLFQRLILMVSRDFNVVLDFFFLKVSRDGCVGGSSCRRGGGLRWFVRSAEAFPLVDSCSGFYGA